MSSQLEQPSMSDEAKLEQLTTSGAANYEWSVCMANLEQPVGVVTTSGQLEQLITSGMANYEQPTMSG